MFVGVEDQTADWLQNAFQLPVEEGNYFGTGRLISRDSGDLVLDQIWSGEAA